MIEVKNLTKSYGSIKAVNGVSFTISSGKVVGLLGPNGAGKTTTLNMITGVLNPDTGSITINDLDLSKHTSQLQKEIGYLAEDNPLYDPMLVAEMLEFAATIKGISTTEYLAGIKKVVEATGIKEIFYRPISTLSKGLRQRVGVAQALLGDPQILILDEPTEGLDPNQRQEIRALILKMAEDHTVLMSSHVMQEVEAICEEIIILNNGEVATQGSVEEITKAQEGKVIVEMAFGGDVDTRIKTLSESYQISDIGRGVYQIELATDAQEELYKELAKATDDGTYLTRLTTRGVDLEEVFGRLTKGTS